MTDGTADRPLHLLIAGGGVAGLEALIAARSLAGDRVRVTLLDPTDEFVYEPMSVAEPFARHGADRTPLAKFARDFSAEHVKDALDRVDPDEHEVITTSGQTIGYDVLLVALGARRRPALANVTTFRGQEDSESVHGLIQDIEDCYVKSVAFVVPGGVTWPLPLYELALMAVGRAREMGQNLDATVVTPEDSPLAAFGQQASGAVAELMREAGIVLETSAYADVEGRRLHLRPGGRDLEPDRIVALPVLEGPAPRGLPADERGFIPTETHGHVPGVEDVYAAGDGTQFPIKQGGVATQQADVAVGDIVGRVGVKLESDDHLRPVLRAKLLTGRGERFLRGDETTGGHGAASEASEHALWWPPSKLAGAYLAPYLAGPDVAAAPERDGLDIELPLS
ncbi:MAG TPA: FAD-dependent oxidoreductase [Solirubrobacteraceae bacterium]|nr:FAD-dependent oxidoreductase [Solirubrobacteraceae bacterium]